MLNYWSKTLEKLNSYYDKIYTNKKYHENSAKQNTPEDDTEYLKRQNELADKIDSLNKTIIVEIQKCIDKAFPGITALCIDTRMYKMEDCYVGNVLIENLQQQSMCYEIERWIECQLSIKVSLSRIEDLDEDLQKTLKEFICQDKEKTIKTTV